MDLLSTLLIPFFVLLASQSTFASGTSQQIPGVAIMQEGPFWVSAWTEFQIPADTASFQINIFGSPETFVQVTDLVAPDGSYFVRSDVNGRLNQYSQPVLKNVISPNRSEAVLKGMSSLLVPNNPALGHPAAGTWKFRTLSHYQPLLKQVSFEIVTKAKTEISKNKVDSRVWISPDSYWTKNPGQVEKVIEAAKQSLAEADLDLRALAVQFLPTKTKEPMELPADMAAIAAVRNSNDAINVYMMPSMEYQNKPINGLACIGGPVDILTSHPCFVSMYASQKGDEITLQNQGKILAHEIGHYLGLFHTQDDYYRIGKVYDPLDDTPQEVTGSNMMDPGIHNETPHFSPLQKAMLHLSPALH
jgi:hypothetical protein